MKLQTKITSASIENFSAEPRDVVLIINQVIVSHFDFELFLTCIVTVRAKE